MTDSHPDRVKHGLYISATAPGVFAGKVLALLLEIVSGLAKFVPADAMSAYLTRASGALKSSDVSRVVRSIYGVWLSLPR